MTDPAPTVTFDYAAWIAIFPEMANVSEPLATEYFNLATLFCANTLRIVCSATKLATLLNLLTAHIAQLFAPQINGQPNNGSGSVPAPNTVGRVSNASEGSVSVGFDMPGQPPAAAWYVQTRYGALFWQATSVYRTMRYIPGPIATPAFPGPLPFGGWRGGFLR